MIVFVAVPMLVLTHRSLRLSSFANTCLFVFLVLHEVGAHFTCGEVPWREWLHAFGVESGSAGSRNHYDRMVHFACGLLDFPSVWELFEARAQPRGIWRYLMPFLFLMGHSVVACRHRLGINALFALSSRALQSAVQQCGSLTPGSGQ